MFLLYLKIRKKSFVFEINILVFYLIANHTGRFLLSIRQLRVTSFLTDFLYICCSSNKSRAANKQKVDCLFLYEIDWLNIKLYNNCFEY